MRSILGVSVLLAGAALVAVLPSAPAVPFPGPDNFGYSASDQSTPGGPTFAWQSIIGQPGTVTWTPNDDTLTTVTLPFSFKFYGNSYSTVYVSDNGYVTFNTCCSAYYASPIPAGGSPQNFIAAYWSDWLPSKGGTFARQISGTPGDYVFTVEYNDIVSWSAGNYKGTFQVKLFQASGCIQILILNAQGNMGGYPAAIGIENAAGNDGIQYGFASPAMPKSNTIVQFCKGPNAKADTASGLVFWEGGDGADLDVLANDEDNAGGGLKIVGFSQPLHGTLQVVGSFPNEKLRYTPSANGNTASPNPPEAFTYTVQDVDGGTATASVTGFTIMPVNDPPVVALQPGPQVPEDAGPVTIPGFATVQPGPTPDEASQTVTQSISVSTPSLFVAPPAIDAAGTLTFEAKPDANGVATVTLVHKDDGMKAKGGEDTTVSTFTITVTPVNLSLIHI